MDLRILLPEILSRVCRFIGLREAEHPLRIYFNRDFHSLRLVCKEIYYKTTYDARIRYEPQLQQLDMTLTYKSLVLLLHIYSVPAFRDKIEVICLRHPCFIRRNVYDVEPYVPSGGEYEAHLYDEGTDALVNSSEAYNLLTACFRELRKSSSIPRKTSVPNKEAHPLIFTALELA